MMQSTLKTNLNHIETEEELRKILKENEKAVVVCGRMGPMCVPVYGIMELMREKYPDISFNDFYFDNPEAAVIRNLPEVQGFRGLPFTIYYKNGEVVKATSSIQEAKDVKKIIKKHLL